MIEYLRLHFKKGILLVVLIIVVIGFVMFGATNVISISPDSYVVQDGKQVLSPSEFQQSVTSIQRSINQNPTLLNVIRDVGVRYPALSQDQLIQLWVIQKTSDQFILLNALSNMHLIVGDQMLANFIAEQKAFQTNGKFDPSLFQQYLENNNITEEKLKKDLRRSFTVQQYTTIMETVPIPVNLIQQFFQLSFASWNVSYKIIPLNSIPKQNVTQPDVQAYYTKYKNQYKIPEERTVDVLFISNHTVAPLIKVTSQDIRNMYNDQKSKFGDNEKRAFEYLVFPTKVAAQKAYTQLQQHHRRKDITEKFNTVSIEATTQKNIPITEVNKIVFSNSIKQYSQPVHLSTGWALIQVTKIIPKHFTPLSKVKNQLINMVKVEETKNFITQLESKVTKDLAVGLSLNSIAKKYHLSLTHLVNVSLHRTGMNKLFNPTAGIVNNLDLLQTIFHTAQNHTSNLINLNSVNNIPSSPKIYGFYIVHTNHILKAHIPFLQSVQQQVRQDVELNKKRNLLNKQTDHLIQAIKKTGKFKDAKQATFLQSKTKNVVLQTIAQHALQHKIKSGTVSKIQTSDGVLVYKINALIPANLRRNQQQYQNFSNQFTRLFNGLIVGSFQKIYAQKYPPKVNSNYMPKAPVQ